MAAGDQRRAAEALLVELQAFEAEERTDEIRIAALRSEAVKSRAPTQILTLYDHLARRLVDRAVRRRTLIENLAAAHGLELEPDSQITAVRPRPSGEYLIPPLRDDD